MDEKAECRNDITFWKFLDMQPEDYSENEFIKTNVNSGWDKKEEDVPKVVILKKKKIHIKETLRNTRTQGFKGWNVGSWSRLPKEHEAYKMQREDAHLVS